MKKIFCFLLLFTFLKAISQSDDQLRTDWANLKRYTNANEQVKNITHKKKHVIFMGNSITEFWRSNDTGFFNERGYINRGISGQTTPQMLVRFRQDVIELKPKAVIILAGINDIAENTGPISLENIFGNIVSMVQLAKANKIKVVLCSVLPANRFSWRQNIKPAEKVIQLNALLKAYAKKHKIVYVDFYSAMVDEDAGLDKMYTNDGVHPTAQGYSVMEPMIEKAIHKVLR